MDPEPFDMAVVAQVTKLRGFACKLCRNDSTAEDLMQDTIVRALSARHQFTPGTNLGAWLMTIMRNTFIGQSRKMRPHEDPDDLMAKTVPAQDDIEAACEARDALTFLVLVPAKMRRALLMAAMGSSIEEIAQAEGVADGTIKSRIHRGRVMLAELIGQPELMAAE
jgi:RNA polymerase sigma-70 factor, ECF subfamily